MTSNYLIEYQCPQCGAPVVLGETDRLFACEYCRVKSYLLGGRYFKYVFPSRAPKDEDIVFFPFWRFKGMGFSCTVNGIQARIIDASQQAVTSSYFPFSLGLRSQVLKLRFATTQMTGRFLKPLLNLNQAKDVIGKRFIKSAQKDSILHHAFIGESISLIYSPYYLKDKVFDGILCEPASAMHVESLNIENYAREHPGRDIRFIASLCPDCGWDMTGQRSSLVMVCHNCTSVWYPSADRFNKLKFACVSDDSAGGVCLPFWRIRADVTGIQLNSYEDFSRVANLPGVIRKRRKQTMFYFWVPAFKVRPQIFLKLAQGITHAQPGRLKASEIPDDTLYPVTLSAGEAVESLKLIVAGFLRPRKVLPEKMPEIRIKTRSALLVYIPFNVGHHEFIQPSFQLAVHKNTLSMAENL